MDFSKKCKLDKGPASLKQSKEPTTSYFLKDNTACVKLLPKWY